MTISRLEMLCRYLKHCPRGQWRSSHRSEFDGAVVRHGDEYFVVLNPESASDRLRFNAAHEVAHLLYDKSNVYRSASDSAVEKRTYAFAIELLLPYSQLSAAFDGRSFLKLIAYKERFGISLAAMIFRAEQLRIINTTASRWLWTEMGTPTGEPTNQVRCGAIEPSSLKRCSNCRQKKRNQLARCREDYGNS